MAVCQLIGNKRPVVVIIRQQIVAVADAEILMYNTMPLRLLKRSPVSRVGIYITVSGALSVYKLKRTSTPEMELGHIL